MFRLAIFIVLCIATAAFHIPRNVLSRKTVTFAKEKEVIPENESEAQLRERMKKKARKMMFNENGVAYAPWVAKQINEDAIIEELIKKEKGNVKAPKTSILDRGEIESSEGMKWRMSGNQVELAWITGEESGNAGYFVEKRPSYGGDFQEVASYKEVAQLASKGGTGGRYRFTDPTTAMGSWIYRVQDCDTAGKKSVLCQCFVEVQTESESKSQGTLVIGFAAAFIAALAIGYSLDPPQ